MISTTDGLAKTQDALLATSQALLEGDSTKNFVITVIIHYGLDSVALMRCDSINCITYITYLASSVGLPSCFDSVNFTIE